MVKAHALFPMLVLQFENLFRDIGAAFFMRGFGHAFFDLGGKTDESRE